ncbi:uncharacterized protein LOC120328447 isoform X2 [Styela clava]
MAGEQIDLDIICRRIRCFIGAYLFRINIITMEPLFSKVFKVIRYVRGFASKCHHDLLHTILKNCLPEFLQSQTMTRNDPRHTPKKPASTELSEAESRDRIPKIMLGLFLLESQQSVFNTIFPSIFVHNEKTLTILVICSLIVVHWLLGQREKMERAIGFLLAMSAILMAIPETTSYHFVPAGRIRRQPPVGMRYRKFAGKLQPSMTQGLKISSARSIGRKGPLYLPARSIYETARRNTHSRRISCPTIRHVDIMSVARESLARINERDGRDILAIKRIARPGVRRCKKCTNGVCVFDHMRATATLVLAPECRSGNCECGVERDRPERSCHISGWTQPGRSAYNIHIRCKDFTMSSGVEVPASRLPHRPTPSRRPTKPRTEETTEGPTTTTLPIVTFPQDFDIDEGGRGDRPTEPEGSGFRPAPILNEEADTSGDSYSEPTPLNGFDKDVAGEELLQ